MFKGPFRENVQGGTQIKGGRSSSLFRVSSVLFRVTSALFRVVSCVIRVVSRHTLDAIVLLDMSYVSIIYPN